MSRIRNSFPWVLQLSIDYDILFFTVKIKRLEIIELYIKRKFLQTRKWINFSIIESISLFPLSYGYEFEDEKEFVVPQMVFQQNILLNIPQACTCFKCKRDNTCLRRVKDIPCCCFCKCRGGCKYTSNITQTN